MHEPEPHTRGRSHAQTCLRGVLSTAPPARGVLCARLAPCRHCVLHIIVGTASGRSGSLTLFPAATGAPLSPAALMYTTWRLCPTRQKVTVCTVTAAPVGAEALYSYFQYIPAAHTVPYCILPVSPQLPYLYRLYLVAYGPRSILGLSCFFTPTFCTIPPPQPPLMLARRRSDAALKSRQQRPDDAGMVVACARDSAL